MRKITFVMGAAVGFLAGSRAGSGPYEQFEGKVRQLLGRQDVQRAIGEIKTTVTEQAASAANLVADKVPGMSVPNSAEKSGQAAQ